MTITIPKEQFFAILKSHSWLTSAEYRRNNSFNNSHPSFIAEENILTVLSKEGELDNFLKYMDKETRDE